MKTVRARVRDSRGNPVVRGTIVSFTVNDPLFGSLSEYVVATDDTGLAQVMFTPGTKSGIAWITATCGTITETAYIIMKAGTPRTLNFTVSNPAIYARGAGEIDATTISAMIYDEFGNPVKDSTEVTFRITSAPSLAPGAAAPSLNPAGANQFISSVRYTLNGRAFISLQAGTKSGTVIVQASVASTPSAVVSEAPRVTIRSGLAYTVSVSREKENVPGWNVDGLPNAITAIVADSMGNPVAPGTAVFFYTYEGTVTGAATVDTLGFAHATWYSSDPRIIGRVWVYASVEGASGVLRSDSVWFYNTGAPTSITSLTSFPATLWQMELLKQHLPLYLRMLTQTL